MDDVFAEVVSRVQTTAQRVGGPPTHGCTCIVMHGGRQFSGRLMCAFGQLAMKMSPACRPAEGS